MSVVAANPVITVALDGAEVARVNTGSAPAGPMAFRAMPNSGGTEPVTVRLSNLTVQRK